MTVEWESLYNAQAREGINNMNTKMEIVVLVAGNDTVYTQGVDKS